MPYIKSGHKENLATKHIHRRTYNFKKKYKYKLNLLLKRKSIVARKTICIICFLFVHIFIRKHRYN